MIKYTLIVISVIFVSACGAPPLARPETAAPLVQEPVSPLRVATATAEVTQPEESSEDSSIEDIQVDVVIELEKQFVEMATTNRLPTQESKTLTPNELKVKFEGWSPDGQQMLLRVKTGKILKGKFPNSLPGMGPAIIGIADLWLADNQGIPTTLLADTVSWPSWSLDGTRVAYIHEFIENEIIVSELWVVQSDGKRPIKLLSGAHNVAWLDNQTVMFIESGSEQLQLVNIHNQKVRPFTIEGLSPEYSQIILYDLSPDRRKLALAGRADRKVRIAEISNGQAKLVTEINVPDLSRMKWSPDSNYLAYAPRCSHPEQNPACQQISIVKTDGIVITHIKHRPDTSVTWSPDGRWIAFQETNRVYVADAESGQFKVLYTFPSGNQNTTESVDWSPVGNRIGLNQDSSGIATILSLKTAR